MQSTGQSLNIKLVAMQKETYVTDECIPFQGVGVISGFPHWSGAVSPMPGTHSLHAFWVQLERKHLPEASALIWASRTAGDAGWRTALVSTQPAGALISLRCSDGVGCRGCHVHLTTKWRNGHFQRWRRIEGRRTSARMMDLDQDSQSTYLTSHKVWR